MNDTTRRFVNAILERLPAGEIVELRLFPAIRQGSIESGAAVIALEPAPILPDPEFVAVPESVESATSETATNGIAPHDGESGTLEAVDAATHDAATHDAATTGTPDSATHTADSGDDSPYLDQGSFRSSGDSDVDGASGEDQELAASAEPVGRRVPDESGQPHESGQPNEMDPGTDLGDLLSAPAASADAPEDSDGVDSGIVAAREAPAAIKRYAILSARYRLTLKGPDRGKWDVELKHEADAPLDTVERVARGVARRAGDESDPEHYSGEDLRLALEAPAWATSA